MRLALACAVLGMVAPRQARCQGVPGTNLTATVELLALEMRGDTTAVTYRVVNHATSLERVAAFTVMAPARPLSISTPAPPRDWLVGRNFGEYTAATWAALEDSILRPGSSSQPLSFRAIGFPGIVDAYLEGDSLPRVEDIPDSLLNAGPLALSVPLRVVGVEPFLDLATPRVLVARLDGLVVETCELGWISDARLCAMLRETLRGGPPNLTLFNSQLTSQDRPGGPESDAAYLLLTLNVDYILRLPRR